MKGVTRALERWATRRADWRRAMGLLRTDGDVARFKKREIHREIARKAAEQSDD